MYRGVICAATHAHFLRVNVHGHHVALWSFLPFSFVFFFFFIAIIVFHLFLHFSLLLLRSHISLPILYASMYTNIALSYDFFSLRLFLLFLVLLLHIHRHRHYLLPFLRLRLLLPRAIHFFLLCFIVTKRSEYQVHALLHDCHVIRY